MQVTAPRIIYQYKYNRVKRTRHGTMLFNIRDTYIGRSLDLYGEWAWSEVEYIRAYAAGLVLDIGANIGTHTLTFAETAEEVIAIEPQYFTYQSLVANLALNAVENVTPLNIAMGAYNGMAPMLRLHPDQKLNFGSLSLGTGDTQVPVRTIDSLLFQNVSFIKIDVEGSEEDVLKGGRGTIMRDRPILYIESDRVEKRASLIEAIEAMGYGWQWHITPIFNPLNFDVNKRNVFGEQCSINLLCIPNERV